MLWTGKNCYKKADDRPISVAPPVARVFRLGLTPYCPVCWSSIVLCVFYYCVCVLLLQDLLQSCSRGGRRRVEDMCYERRRAEACVDESAHHALVNAGGREIV